MGSGRSGTSMISGILHDAGYFMGDLLYPATSSNPKGYFESSEINGINEQILSNYDSSNPGYCEKFLRGSFINTAKWYCRLPRLFRKYLSTDIYKPGYLQRWLSFIPVDVDIDCWSAEVKTRIEYATERKPFAYKDPRFSYTLPVWKKSIGDDVVFICIFRDPSVTVNSIIRECSTASYLRNFQINESDAYEVWNNIYSHIIDKHLADSNNFIFCHYDQIYNGSSLPILSKTLNADLKHDFVSTKLKRSRSNSMAPERSRIIYNKLCELAYYRSGS